MQVAPGTFLFCITRKALLVIINPLQIKLKFVTLLLAKPSRHLWVFGRCKIPKAKMHCLVGSYISEGVPVTDKT